MDASPIESISKYKEGTRKRLHIGKVTKCCLFLVEHLQKIYVPSSISSYIPVSVHPLSSNNDDDNDAFNNIHPPGRIPFLHGLERVITTGQPASETVYICGIKPIRYLWYMLSGSICDVIQFLIDLALLRIFKVKDPSYCWAIGFALSVVFRHTSHRYLIFGDYVGGYWNSLRRMYAGYSVIIVISTLFNIIMTKFFRLNHYLAWVITLLWTGVVNYFILKSLWSFDGSRDDGIPAKVTKSSSVHIV